MKEEFIHFLWKYRLFQSQKLKTTEGKSLQIIQPGWHNMDSGPDFSAARIEIDGTTWAGNVEIHLKSSDWYKHGHQHSEDYHNIILHVVMMHDEEIKDKNGSPIPVFEVQSCFDPSLLHQYENLLNAKTWIPCERIINQASELIIHTWLSRLLVERLENKSKEILQFLAYFENNWEQTLYYFLARNFGFKTNASPFALLAQKTPYLILGKHSDDLTQTEALLFGQAGMLANNFKDAYPSLLKKEYEFLRHKYQLTPIDKSLWKFSKLRPANFPTLRVAQFAGLQHRSQSLFASLMPAKTFAEVKNIFNIQCSPYWDSHYQFDKVSVKRIKKLGDTAVANIIINTLVPVKFLYGKENMKAHYQDEAIALLSELPPERNAITDRWAQLGIKATSAAESQALLELKKYYCTPKKCLNCAIGLDLIRKS